MIVCEGCGTVNEDDAVYCVKCARKLDVETQQAVAEARASHTATGTRWGPVVLTAIVIVAVIVVILLFVAGVI